MVLFPIVNMPIFLVLRGLASWTHVSDNHGLLLTSTGLISVFGQQYHRNRWASITWASLPFTPVTLVHFAVDNAPILQVHGLQDHHLIVCEAVGIDHAC